MRQGAWAGKAAAAVAVVALLLGQPAKAWGQRGPGAKPDAAALAEAQQLDNEVFRLDGEGKYDAAVPLAERVVRILEKELGPEHPVVAQSLHNLAVLQEARKKYDIAEPLYERALR